MRRARRSERHSGGRLRVSDAVDRADLRNDDLPNHVVIRRLDLRNQIILTEPREELNDFLDLEQLLVHLALPRGMRTDQAKPDRRPTTDRGRTWGAYMQVAISLGEL